MAVRDRANDVLRRRELASSNRSGRYARDEIWSRNLRLVRRAWQYILAPFVFVPGCLLPVALTYYSGSARGFVVGVAFASALWIDVVAVLMFSGTIGSFAGVMAETATADELRRLRPK